MKKTMKKLLLAMCCVLFLATSAWAIRCMVVGGGGAVCGDTPFDSSTNVGEGLNVMYDNTQYYGGKLAYNPGQSREVCKIEFMCDTVLGTVDNSFTFYCGIYETGASSALGTLKATSNGVLGGSISANNPIVFTFSTPYTITNGTDYNFAVWHDQSPSTSNRIVLECNFVDSGMDGGFQRWSNVGTATGGSATFDPYIKLYEME